MPVYNVKVKWMKQVFDSVPLDTSESPEVFKAQLFGLTNVPVDRMKVMIPKGGQLKDDSKWESFKDLKDGTVLTLIGTVKNTLNKPDEKIQFLEDLPASRRMAAAAEYPPGLMNLENTCYFNSTVQSLISIPEVRKAIKEFPGSFTANDTQKNIALGFRDLIKALEGSGIALPPLSLLSLFRAAFPQFAERQQGHYVQQDADECFKQLVNTLRSIPALPGDRGAENMVEQLFGGKMQVQYKCVEDESDVSDISSENFQYLQCNIDNETAFLLNALQSSLSEHITKFSSNLGRDAVYTKESLISELPFCLPVQFVRFWHNAQENVNAKICRPVEFPMVLDLYTLCTPDLKQRMDEPRLEVLGDKMTDVVESKSDEPSFVNKTGLYELQAVISHRGRSVDSGHYVAWVRQNEDDWLLFDDDKVSPKKTEDIKKLSGKGGVDWHIAYICLYRTKN